MHAKPYTHDMDIGKQDDNAIKKGDIMSVYNVPRRKIH